jgi:hypothetical protein
MNKTKNILLIAAITSLLMMGTSVIPMQSYAGEHKKTGDLKASIKASSEVDKKSANQHLDQNNFCYRSDNCNQANQAQQLVGENNEATGFNDQSALESVDNQGQPGPIGPECPGGYTFNDVTQKCEKPACTDGFTFNAGTLQCERTRTTQATCPDGSAATGSTCPETTTNVPATCPTTPVHFSGPFSSNILNSNYICVGDAPIIQPICPDGSAPTGFICPGTDIPAMCPPGTFPANGHCTADQIITPPICPDGGFTNSLTCTVTVPASQATCPAGTTGPDATGRCTGTETGVKQCANPTSTGVCQTSPRF